MHLQTVLLAVCLVICSMATAQTDGSLQKTKKKSCSCSFSSINQGGIMRGEEGSYFQFQTINGFRYKTWFGGLGVGIDRYPVGGIPVFLDIRKHIIDQLHSAFFYAEAGIHIADKASHQIGMQRIEYTNGAFYDVGLGFRIGLSKKSGLLLSGGYSYKNYERKESYTETGCNFFPCNAGTQIYSYRLNRLSLKVGLQL